MSYDAAERPRRWRRISALAEQVKQLRQNAAALRSSWPALDSGWRASFRKRRRCCVTLTPELLAQMNKCNATQNIEDQAQMSLKDLQAMQQAARAVGAPRCQARRARGAV